ncbi:hypothetical protein A3H11_04915 [Candidatus Uhrbacteria bacterium RIFCSPLOWO2_12_FULL_47_10]|nr:MAG: hypothetical protein A3J03_00675 [Candidatus Uhrbacteria bacterium RIFCSPLOWO2_02_FULL_46_25]OGL91624.1 MAG: hypothetical protein A3H11_04915 [Candidatus Uhrbacteria bacterium RIFCSPLOWO2_12_FULL_47_10]
MIDDTQMKHHPFLEYFIANIPFLQKLPTHFIFFAFFGGIATIVDWGIFYITHYRIGWHYLAGVTLSFVFGSLISFLGNKYLNFCDSSKRVLLQYGIFIGVASSGLLITYGILTILIGRLGLHAMLARMISTFLVLFYNYFSQKNITFKRSLTL